MCSYRLVALVMGGVCACTLAGCSPGEEPQRYQVPKEEMAESVHDMGAMASVAQTTSGGLRLAYDTPEGWATGRVGGMRKAAFVVEDGQQKVEITAIDLAANAGALLPNINRWRQQIELGEITQEELDTESTPIQVAGVEGRYVELVGPEADARQAVLGVVVIQGARAWFFKLWGDSELALREKERFLEFVKSVRFEAPGHGGATLASAGHGRGSSPLEYDSPEGWQPISVGGMRKAAFLVSDGERKVQITAIDLAPQAGALLPNVNRWRGQIGLGEVTQDELEKTLTSILVLGVEGHYVELVGPEQADSRRAILGIVAIQGGRSWFFKLWGDAELALREKERFQDFVKSVRMETTENQGSSSSVADDDGKGALTYDAPEGWVPGPAGGMRKAAFVVEDGEQQVDVTAIDLAASAGALLPNVNRWRQQIQLGEITQAELEKTVIPIQVAGMEGHYVELVGPEDSQQRRAILGVVAIRDGRAWFLNLAGDADLALREKERFLGFVRSVKFATADGAEDAK